MPGRRHSVLVAENNRAVAQAIRLHLEKAGFSVFIAHDGDQAAILAARQRFDLILTDLDLPLMSGQEFCRHLREDLRLTEIPLAVCVSASQRSHAEPLVYKHDIARIFQKPIDPALVSEFALHAVSGVIASI